MFQDLDENELIIEHQFGFRPGHSTVYQQNLTYEGITKLTEIGITVDLLFFDFSKALDKVCHDILLQKMSEIVLKNEILA